MKCQCNRKMKSAYYCDVCEYTEENGLEASNAKLREALKRIADFVPDYSEVEKVREKVQTEGECSECVRRQIKNWPPSGLCDRHYGILQMEIPKMISNANGSQHFDMRQIAIAALADDGGEE